ncbi:transglycosylase domain-containing protein [Variovorax terrae]|uniref:Biosynthetic peptidoglycan transglycosylase n=1 Tax=Variovorax terrae TaxID=2923278 RepID=A0A9X2AKW6_9BURK|nr:transglycosylase domain-containing protein [Variovorax terrae]MCJ0761988.1 transglycosylase domain-containing protein [Variovorax terrae]
MKALLRWIGLVVVAAVALQLFFVGRIALMLVVDPQSTTFQRSEAWRLATETGRLPWRQQWVPYAQISDNLKRAVIASEDDSFVNHDGVDWDAIEKAWQKNAKAEEQAARRAQLARSSTRPTARAPKIVGGSTITQQLAKNLLLSGERTLLRKGQEFVLTLLLEHLLGKQRILEIYLNSVEWGDGVFGAEAAAQHYYRKPAARLSAYEAARLAVMLPRPKFFEKLPNSAYLSNRASTIVARMGDAELP